MKKLILSLMALAALGLASAAMAGYDPGTGGGKGEQFNRPDYAQPDLPKPPIGETPPVEKQPRPNPEAPH